MNRAAVYHCSSFSYAYPVEKDVLCVRLLTQKDDVRKVKVHFRNLYEHMAPMTVVPMEKLFSDGLHDMYEARIQVKERRFKYLFEIESDEQVFYTSDGFMEDWKENNCFFYPYSNMDEVLKMPKWAEGKFIYQVLVDRFRDGNPENNPEGCKGWEEIPDNMTYYGGDFEGLIQELPYLEKMGVDILYLSPVFASPTYHKYDIMDYYKIEDIYGGKEGLKKLVEEAHAKGIKVVLDGVFNHCSSKHPFFKDVMEKGQESAYCDWFCIYNYPVNEEKGNYESFGNLVPNMPRWNTVNPEVIDYLTETAVYWTNYLNIDGWRLDVADEVAHTFWKEFQRRLYLVREDILIIGEIWNHASQWMCGDEMHTVTNYKFRNAILAYAKGSIEEEEFWQQIDMVRELYKTPMHTFLVNLAGSHDVERIQNIFPDSKMVRAILMTVMTFQGMPLIYYGDEIGMTGDEDPDNRRAMQWNHMDKKLLETIRRIGMFRKGNAVLQKGNLKPIQNEQHLLAFSREYEGDKVEVYINFHDETVLLMNGQVLFAESAVCSETEARLEKGGMLIVRR